MQIVLTLETNMKVMLSSVSDTYDMSTYVYGCMNCTLLGIDVEYMCVMVSTSCLCLSHKCGFQYWIAVQLMILAVESTMQTWVGGGVADCVVDTEHTCASCLHV